MKTKLERHRTNECTLQKWARPILKVIQNRSSERIIRQHDASIANRPDDRSHRRHSPRQHHGHSEEQIHLSAHRPPSILDRAFPMHRISGIALLGRLATRPHSHLSRAHPDSENCDGTPEEDIR